MCESTWKVESSWKVEDYIGKAGWVGPHVSDLRLGPLGHVLLCYIWSKETWVQGGPVIMALTIARKWCLFISGVSGSGGEEGV